MGHRTTILLVDDHATYRTVLRSLLAAEPSFEIVGEAADGASALRLAERLEPDVAIVDVSLSGGVSGVDVARALGARAAAGHPAAKVFGLTMSALQARVAMLEAGAVDCLPKERADELIPAIKAAVASSETSASVAAAAD